MSDTAQTTMAKQISTNTNDVGAPAARRLDVAHNAFTATGPAIRIQPTAVSKSLATRVNKNTHAVAWCGSTKGERVPR